MITILDLTVKYNIHKTVLNALQLTLKDENIHGIVGLNGSGKTTLLNTIFGLIKQQNGEISYNGKRLTKKEISFLPAENFFYSKITGKEYLSLFKNPNFDIEKWNDLFQLPLHQIIDTYSTGMKKKLALMSILKKDKPILILDEPFNGLDLETSRIIRSILLRLKEKGKLIIVTSHILETLTNMCDYIHLLENGEIKVSHEKIKFQEFKKELFSQLEQKNKTLIDKLTL